MTVGISKISIMKLYYPIIFAYISVLSILLALVIGYASYALTMVYAILLIMLIVKKNMYKKTFNQIRAIINNSIIIIICIIFIIADAVDIETGIGASIALGVILFLNLIFNLAIFVYQVYYEYKINSK